MTLECYYAGARCGIWLCPGAQASWDAANQSVREKARSQLHARLTLLGDSGQLRSPDHMNKEGYGIFAAKTPCGIRAYGWFTSVSGQKAFVISHVIYKDQQKLDPKDLAQAVKAKETYEAENDQ